MNDARGSGPQAVAANPLLSAPILPTLLRLSLPNLAAMLAAALVAVGETLYAGLLGTGPLAAMALVFPLTMLMQMLSSGAMGGGVSSAISRALGAGDAARADALARHAAFIGGCVGAGFSLLFLLLSEPILRLIGGRGEVLDHALRYANIALACAVLVWLVNILASIVRGTGNMRVPALTVLGASALQFVIGGTLGLGLGPFPRLGMAGIATGLVVAYGLATLFLLWFLCTGRARVRLRPGPVDRDMFADILKVGAASAISPLQTVLNVLILTALVARFGAEALAGYGIGARLELLLVPIVFAVGVASVPMVGMAIGANDVARARRVAWSSAAVCVVALGAIGLTVALVPHLWSGLFSAHPGVRAASDLYLLWAGPGFAFVGLGLSLYFASQGSGKVLQPVLAGTIRLWLVIAGGLWLSAIDAPLWAFFALVTASMVAFGACVALAVYLTPWGVRAAVRQTP